MPAYRRKTYTRRPSGYSRKLVRKARYVNKNYPSKFYGVRYLPRGTEESLQAFGQNKALATPAQQTNRKAVGFTGNGGYFGQRAGDWMSGMTGITGLGQIGSQMENRAINSIQNAGNRFLNGYTGRGEYESNALINPTGNDQLQLSTSGLDATALNVKHREYIGDIMGSNAFQNNTQVINPGNSQLFPWLSQVAVNFDEYEFNQLIFGFKSVTADVTTATVQIGSVIMACNYNVTSQPFQSKIPMMEYESSTSAKITDNLTFGIECDPTKNGLGAILYVTNQPTAPAGQDPKTYFLGLMQIAVNQTLATGEVGEYWVEYDITLRKKKLFTALGNNILSLGFSNYTSTNQGQYTNQSTLTNIFGFPSGTTQVSNIFSQNPQPGSGPGLTPITLWLTNTFRSGYWSNTTKNNWNLVVSYNTGICYVTLFFPDNYTGTFATSFDAAGLTTTTFAAPITNNITANGVLADDATSNNLVRSLFQGNVSQSANTIGQGNASSAGTFIQWSLQYTISNANIPANANFWLTQLSNLD